MSHGLLLGGIEACALKNNINIKLAPRAVVGVLLSVDLDLLTINDDGIIGSFNGVFAFTDAADEGTRGGIVLQKVSKHLGAGEVVDSNNFITLSFKHLTECKTTDAAETVNSNFYCHDLTSSVFCWFG